MKFSATRTTQFGRYPVEKADLGRTSLVSAPITARRSQTIMQHKSSSIPKNMTEESNRASTLRIPSSIFLSAQDRSSKIHM